MQTLQQALDNFSKTLTVSRHQTGHTTPSTNTSGTTIRPTECGEASNGTGLALIANSHSNETGTELGRIGAIGKPRTAEEAADLAEALTATLLPPSMARHLEWQEQTQASGQTAYPIVPAPVATPLMMQTISQTVMSLSEILAPARQRPNELAEVIGKLFAAFNQFTGDAAKTAAQVDVWAEELSEFPLYAIRKAYKWAVRGEGKLPSLSAFIADAKLAVGTNVLERNRLLVGWLARHRKDSIGGNAR